MDIAKQVVSKETKAKVIAKTTAKIASDNKAVKKLLGKGSRRLR